MSNISFALNDKQQKQYERWWKRHHQRECGFNGKAPTAYNRPSPTLGETISFIFTGHGLGFCVQAQCACKWGKYEIDLTDFSDW